MIKERIGWYRIRLGPDGLHDSQDRRREVLLTVCFPSSPCQSSAYEHQSFSISLILTVPR